MVDQNLNALMGDLLVGLADGCQRGDGVAAGINAVKADDRNIFRHSQTLVVDGPSGFQSQKVGDTKQAGKIPFLKELGGRVIALLQGKSPGIDSFDLLIVILGAVAGKMR